MDDKKLLELAAKAAEINAVFVDTHYEKMFKVPYTEPNVNGWREWNPLTDDGDALRLAVKMKINLDWTVYDWVISVTGLVSEHGIVSELGNDPLAATRRAIVRAAAEIGKNKD